MINFSKQLLGAFILGLLFTACQKEELPNVSKQITEGFQLDSLNLGTLNSRKINDTYIHLYHGTDLAEVNSYAIETTNKIVVIDALHFQSRANEMRNFINFLGKDITRVIISHSHADHYMGLGAFSDLPTYATSEAIANINNEGENARLFRLSLGQPFTSEYPSSVTIPQNTLENKFSIDNIDYEIEKFTNTEAKDEIFLKIPSLNVVCTADLISVQKHKIIIDASQYITALEQLKTLENDGYNILLTGHNGFESFAIIDDNLNYLRAAKQILDTNPTATSYQAQIEAAFPSYGDASFIVQLMSLEGVF